MIRPSPDGLPHVGHGLGSGSMTVVLIGTGVLLPAR